MIENLKNTNTTLLEEDDAPELTDAFFSQANEYMGEKLVKRGRPVGSVQTVHKAPVTIRLDEAALNAWRASGKGWQTRAAELLAKHAP
jgi:uncharacterized protein (DUF4415 family)